MWEDTLCGLSEYMKCDYKNQSHVRLLFRVFTFIRPLERHAAKDIAIVPEE